MSLWRERDEPVLRHLAGSPPEHGMLWTHRTSEAPHADVPHLTEAEFFRSVLTLGDAGYLGWSKAKGESGGSWYFPHFQVTGAGKQQLGLWPHFEALGSPTALAALLERMADEAATEEERSNLRRAGEAVKRTAPELVRSAFVGVASGIARSFVGL